MLAHSVLLSSKLVGSALPLLASPPTIASLEDKPAPERERQEEVDTVDAVGAVDAVDFLMLDTPPPCAHSQITQNTSEST